MQLGGGGNSGVLFYGRSSCLTFDNVISVKKNGVENTDCKQLNEWAFHKIKDYPGVPLISISRTSSYLQGPNEPERSDEVDLISVYFGTKYKSRRDPKYIAEFKETLISTACRIAEERPVYLMRPVPEFGTSVPNDLARNILFRNDKSDIKITIQEYMARNKEVWEAQDIAAKQCGVNILNPLPYLCDDMYCYGSKNGRPLYVDDDHMSEYGNKFLIPMFEQIFRNQESSLTLN